jgi:Zn-finger nucleic acid-binding protein
MPSGVAETKHDVGMRGLHVVSYEKHTDQVLHQREQYEKNKKEQALFTDLGPYANKRQP